MTVRVNMVFRQIVDAGNAPPVITADADAAVAVISTTGRFYWQAEGTEYYVDGTPVSTTPAPIFAGMPMGLLAAITYPVSTS